MSSGDFHRPAPLRSKEHDNSVRHQIRIQVLKHHVDSKVVFFAPAE